jgi:hypothetical protein
MTMLWLAVDGQETIIVKIYYQVSYIHYQVSYIHYQVSYIHYQVSYNIDNPFFRRGVHHTLLSHEK